MEISLMPHGKWLFTHSCSRTIYVASHVSSRYLRVEDKGTGEEWAWACVLAVNSRPVLSRLSVRPFLPSSSSSSLSFVCPSGWLGWHRKCGIASNLKGVLLFIYLEEKPSACVAIPPIHPPSQPACSRRCTHVDVKWIPICLAGLLWAARTKWRL